MPKCSYCGKMYDIPHGLTLVMTDGSVKHLCSSKCQKNMKMKRRKTRWISKMKKSKAEELAEVIEESKESEK
jgi:ribosomal protein L24E